MSIIYIDWIYVYVIVLILKVFVVRSYSKVFLVDLFLGLLMIN